MLQLQSINWIKLNNNKFALSDNSEIDDKLNFYKSYKDLFYLELKKI